MQKVGVDNNNPVKIGNKQSDFLYGVSESGTIKLTHKPGKIPLRKF